MKGVTHVWEHVLPMSPGHTHSGSSYQTAITAGASRSFILALKANEFVQMTIDQQGIDLVNSIYDPAGKLLHKADWRWIGAESLSWTANTTGQYRVEISARR